jgi:hypothetical protein
LGLNSGIRFRSESTAQTRSGGAAISMVAVNGFGNAPSGIRDMCYRESYCVPLTAGRM